LIKYIKGSPNLQCSGPPTFTEDRQLTAGRIVPEALKSYI
jgi:hypothetical protein